MNQCHEMANYGKRTKSVTGAGSMGGKVRTRGTMTRAIWWKHKETKLYLRWNRRSSRSWPPPALTVKNKKSTKSVTGAGSMGGKVRTRGTMTRAIWWKHKESNHTRSTIRALMVIKFRILESLIGTGPYPFLPIN
jgi:hypothetical protein